MSKNVRPLDKGEGGKAALRQRLVELNLLNDSMYLLLNDCEDTDGTKASLASELCNILNSVAKMSIVLASRVQLAMVTQGVPDA